MFEILKAEHYARCNCCFSNKNVIHIVFQNETGHWNAVSLCESCVKELMDALKQKCGDDHADLL